ncbi:MAG: hypothetical protein OIF47_07030 [Marinibacterium sp.]|nr:hypothetical protein [Marinibacterium sp.]
MADAVASAQLAPVQAAYRIVITSIGDARPSDAASIAVGLGVPVNRVLEAVYRAPSVLVDGLDAPTARQMGDLLGSLGCGVDVQSANGPAPAPADLYDVALHIEDTARYGAIVDALAGFLGAKPDDAARLVATPPGVVLGQVSRATIDALRQRLGDGAGLIVSDPDSALYDLFLGACDQAVVMRLQGDLRRAGFEPLAETGCVLSGLPRDVAEGLWSAHHRIGALRLVNRDFLRFDVVMTGGTPSPAASAALQDLAGIPDHIVPRLFGAGEITLIDALPLAELADVLDGLAGAGLEIRADLVSFAHLGLDITRAPRPADVRDTLAAIGIGVDEAALRQLPYRLPCALPELQARLLRDALALCGAQADLIDEAAA